MDGACLEEEAEDMDMWVHYNQEVLHVSVLQTSITCMLIKLLAQLQGRGGRPFP